MDFAIVISDDGKATGEMAFNEPGSNNLINNIYLSLKVKRGSWWFKQSFGSRLHLLKKNLPDAGKRAIEYCQEATQWIIDNGKATAINFTVERNMRENPNRLKLLIEAYPPDGEPVTFSYFVEVV